MTLLETRRPHALAGALCCGLAAANLARGPVMGLAVACAVLVPLAGAAEGAARVALLACALALVGWCWGGFRLDRLDRSALRADVGRAGDTLVEVTAPARRGRYVLRIPARVLRFGEAQVREPVLLELPAGRAPPQGALLEVLGQLKLPRGPSAGFDERRWLRRQGIHVVLRGDRWRIVGRRGGLGGIADRLHGWLGRSAAVGLGGERRGVVEGVVLGEDQGLSDGLRSDFRASGLYHLLTYAKLSITTFGEADDNHAQLDRDNQGAVMRVWATLPTATHDEPSPIPAQRPHPGRGVTYRKREILDALAENAEREEAAFTAWMAEGEAVRAEQRELFLQARAVGLTVAEVSAALGSRWMSKSKVAHEIREAQKAEVSRLYKAVDDLLSEESS